MSEASSVVVLVDEALGGATDELIHLFCKCEPDVSLCGIDISDMAMVEGGDDADHCVVCDDLLWTACRFCGRVDG